MIRIVAAALAALVAGAAPGLAQITYAPEVSAPRAVTIVRAPVVVPADVAVPASSYRVVVRPVLVPRTHYVRRTVLVARTRFVRRSLRVPVTTYLARTSVATVPVGPYAVGDPAAGFGPVYPGTGLVGPTWVPPGTTYACQLGTVGCDSSVVGAMGF